MKIVYMRFQEDEQKTKYLAFLGFVVSHCCFLLVYLFVLDLSTHSIENVEQSLGLLVESLLTRKNWLLSLFLLL